MREAENIRAVSELGIDMIGLNFWPESPRFVKMISSRAGFLPDFSRERLRQAKGLTDEASSRESTEILPPKRVGVFVDEMPQSIVTRIYNFNLDFVQLHGDENRTMIENLRRTVDPDIRAGIKVIKTISVASADDFQRCEQYEGAVDLFLFDTKCPEKGGSGRHFDWALLDQYQGKTPFLLSGGIGEDDVEAILNIRHEQFAGVDVNSRFELEPGLKDVDRLARFVEALRK